jgi:GNAT superfamily N-acetyltransferase
MLRIRQAVVDDIPLLLKMIVEFATFENLLEYVTVTEESLRRDGFGVQPRFYAMILEWDGAVAGYAMTYPFYSSFAGPGLFLEDIYVRDAFRGRGIGKAVMAEVGAMALREGYWGVRWEVLNWNQPAIDFYLGLGATFVEDWKLVMIEGEALRNMARGSRQ